MTQSENGNFRKNLFNSVSVPCLLLLVLMLFVVHPGTAEGSGDPYDPAFLSMQSDLRACIQPGPAAVPARIAFAKKYKASMGRLEQLAAAGANSTPWCHLVCETEIEFVIGAVVWRIRADQDRWNFTCGREDIEEYCARQCTLFNHWNWHKGEMPAKDNRDCYDH
jgi:hypothetical protein